MIRTVAAIQSLVALLLLQELSLAARRPVFLPLAVRRPASLPLAVHRPVFLPLAVRQVLGVVVQPVRLVAETVPVAVAKPSLQGAWLRSLG